MQKGARGKQERAPPPKKRKVTTTLPRLFLLLCVLLLFPLSFVGVVAVALLGAAAFSSFLLGGAAGAGRPVGWCCFPLLLGDVASENDCRAVQ